MGDGTAYSATIVPPLDCNLANSLPRFCHPYGA